jgi:hypothetical protein
MRLRLILVATLLLSATWFACGRPLPVGTFGRGYKEPSNIGETRADSAAVGPAAIPK